MKTRPGILVVVGLVLMPPAVFGQSGTNPGLAGDALKSVKVALLPLLQPQPALKYQLLPLLPDAGRVRGGLVERIPAGETHFLTEWDKVDGCSTRSSDGWTSPGRPA